jgi:hypothetical protein
MRWRLTQRPNGLSRHHSELPYNNKTEYLENNSLRGRNEHNPC